MANTTRMTVAQAIVKFLDNQYVSQDGQETKFVEGFFTIFGFFLVFLFSITALPRFCQNMNFPGRHPSVQGLVPVRGGNPFHYLIA